MDASAAPAASAVTRPDYQPGDTLGYALHGLPGFEDIDCPSSHDSLQHVGLQGGPRAFIRPWRPQSRPRDTRLPVDQMGEHIARRIQQANRGPDDLDRGVHYWTSYRDLCAARDPARWDEAKYRGGYTSGKYWKRTGRYQWTLKEGVSASKAIKRFLSGLTICECLSLVRAVEADALRAAVGDTKFDAEFGDEDGHVPRERRLRIGMHESTVQKRFMKPTDAARAGGPRDPSGRDLVVGARYYFANHPYYPYRHPAGLFQGENSVYLGIIAGKPTFEGFGMAEFTEDRIYDVMVGEYNLPPSEASKDKLKEIRIAHGGLPEKYRAAPPRINPEDLLTDVVDGKSGGLRINTSLQLDAAAVKRLRGGR